MKTVKLIIGIVSIVLTFLIIFQSCAAGLGDAIADNGGTSGVFKDLIFWGVLDFIFAVVFVISVIICKKAPKTRSEQE